jgi:hypothetical protein
MLLQQGRAHRAACIAPDLAGLSGIVSAASAASVASGRSIQCMDGRT